MRFVTEQELRDQWGEQTPATYHIPAGARLTPAAHTLCADRRVRLVEAARGGVPGAARGGASGAVAATPPAGAVGSAIPVGVSARHVHLSPEHVAALFGPGHQLQPLRPLSQPGQFAAQETVVVAGPQGSFAGVRVLGPARGNSQVELARTDGYQLGLQPPVRLSGDIAGTPGVTLIGPQGAVTLAEGAIVAQRHLHMTPRDAQAYGVVPGQVVQVACGGAGRGLIFGAVVVRVAERFQLELHLDTDEANAAGLRGGVDQVWLLKG